MKEYDLTKSEWDFIRDFLQAKGLPVDRNLTFGDVSIKTQFSRVRSRSEINDFKISLTPYLQLNVPFIMANMVSVADARAIVAIEREGGLGIPPQMLSLKRRLEMLERIGRAESAHIDRPLTIGPEKTLAEAKQAMNKGIHSLVVVDDEHRPIGILSTRDWRYEEDDARLVRDLMGGRRKLYTGPKNISFADAGKILRKHRIEKLPLVDKRGRLVALITAHGLFYKHHHPRATGDGKGRFIKVGSIGVGKRFTTEHMKEVDAQMKKGILLLLVDTARAFSVNTKEAVEAIKARHPKLPLMVGNVDSPEGAKALFNWGASIVKVGIGPGEACRTREVGVGTPQLSAVAKCAAIAELRRREGHPAAIVADGGMKNPGDICKALIAGADAIMSGSLFIGAIESAGKGEVTKDGFWVKKYIGSASSEAQETRIHEGTLDVSRRPEGVSQPMPVIGTMKDLIEELLRGMRSTMSYAGVTSVAELKEKGRLELQTSAGLFEGIKKK